MKRSDGLHVAHGAAEVHAAGGDRDERLLAVGRAVDLLVARADVDGRLADLADPLHDRDDPRDVGVGLEVVRLADRLPGDLRALEQRRAEREAERRQRERERGDGAGAVRGQRHHASARDRLAFEGARRSCGLRCTWTSALCDRPPCPANNNDRSVSGGRSRPRPRLRASPALRSARAGSPRRAPGQSARSRRPARRPPRGRRARPAAPGRARTADRRRAARGPGRPGRTTRPSP